MESSLLIELTRAYFVQVDDGRFPDELFAPDFEFYFPKYGIGRGLKDLREFASGLASAGYKMVHDRHHLKYIACGRQVIVEGTTSGADGEGSEWDGGRTAGGRFCSVFDFTDDGFIKRMYIYLDPDYTSRDKDRFHWQRADPRW